MNDNKIFDILVINPGSTSTKVAIYKDEKEVISESLKHSSNELGKCAGVWDQYDLRMKAIRSFLTKHSINPKELSAVIGRGGMVKPIPGGTYKINKQMIEDAKINYQGEHCSNLGCALADEIAAIGNIPAYTVDPVAVDEFEPIARLSGHPLLNRRAFGHPLNMHEAARRAAAKLGKEYQNSQFVVAHLGGGISVSPVKNGRIIDINDASSGGPFSPDRTGSVPLQPFITLCFSGDYSEDDMRRMVMGRGGLKAYLGTHSGEEIEKRIADGDEKAKLVYQAMAYQIAKEVGAMATVLNGKVDAVVLTGGLTHSKMLMEWIMERVAYIAPIIIFHGEFEFEAMVFSVLRVLRKEEEASEY